ncbi:MAG: hypothetical protein K1060chlam5_00289 [Candidatus Anoxychlamydiales bacterium]|nr:hypothetical protein [Candidatus Anoxychlamydiales bacterium]
MKKFIISIKILSLIVISSLCIKFYQLYTDGFRIDKINFVSFYNNKIQNEDQSNEIDEIISQRFKYLSKGCQTYVFISEDENYVLKFIRFHRYKVPFWLDNLHSKYFLDNYYNKIKKHKEKLFLQSINSYKIAFDYLKDETKILYIHLNQTNNLNKKVTLLDKFNQKYKINLDDYGFILQKKADSLSKHLQNNKNNKTILQKTTLSFINLTDSIYKKGFINSDYNCIKNAGIIENTVIFTDLGSFKKIENLNNKFIYEREFNKFIKYYKRWTNKYSPDLTVFLDEKIYEKSKKSNLK